MVSCRNRVGHFQWVFPTSRGLFSLLLGGLNTSATGEQPGEQPTFRMTLLRDSVTKYRCQAFSPFNFHPGLDPVLFGGKVLVCNDVSQARSFESKSPPFFGVRS